MGVNGGVREGGEGSWVGVRNGEWELGEGVRKGREGE